MDETDIAREAVDDVAAGTAVLLDVRRDEEFDDSRAEGAVHWPLANLKAGLMPDIEPETKVYVYCASGGRAEEAREILLAHGYSDVISIGGLADWQRAGGEVE
jgi:rhodanese-related sulfurtransferase